AGRPRRRVGRGSPPNMANAGEPATAGASACAPEAIADPDARATGCGSTHTLCSHTRGSLQSVSLLHPTDRDWAPLHPAAATAATAIAPKPALTAATLTRNPAKTSANGGQRLRPWADHSRIVRQASRSSGAFPRA